MTDADRPRSQATTSVAAHETLECADAASLKPLLAEIFNQGGRVVALIKNQETGGYSIVIDRGLLQ